MGGRVPHRAGQYRAPRSRLPSRNCWSCRFVAVFVIRGWDTILRGCEGTSMLSRGKNSPCDLALCAPQKRQLVDGGGVSTEFGAVSAREITVNDRVVGVEDVRKKFRIRGRAIVLPCPAGPRHWAMEQFSRRAGSMSPSQTVIIQWT